MELLLHFRPFLHAHFDLIFLLDLSVPPDPTFLLNLNFRLVFIFLPDFVYLPIASNLIFPLFLLLLAVSFPLLHLVTL